MFSRRLLLIDILLKSFVGCFERGDLVCESVIFRKRAIQFFGESIVFSSERSVLVFELKRAFLAFFWLC